MSEAVLMSFKHVLINFVGHYVYSALVSMPGSCHLTGRTSICTVSMG